MGEECLLEINFDFTVTGNRGEMRVLTSTKQGNTPTETEKDADEKQGGRD